MWGGENTESHGNVRQLCFQRWEGGLVQCRGAWIWSRPGERRDFLLRLQKVRSHLPGCRLTPLVFVILWVGWTGQLMAGEARCGCGVLSAKKCYLMSVDGKQHRNPHTELCLLSGPWFKAVSAFFLVVNLSPWFGRGNGQTMFQLWSWPLIYVHPLVFVNSSGVRVLIRHVCEGRCSGPVSGVARPQRRAFQHHPCWTARRAAAAAHI